MTIKTKFLKHFVIGLFLVAMTFLYSEFSSKLENLPQVTEIPKKEKPKSLDEVAAYHDDRFLHEYYRQANTASGKIPYEEKMTETLRAKALLNTSGMYSRNVEFNYQNRGPSNLGGRARAIVIDKSDPSENTLLAAGVSGGVFRTTNGGASWVKVSPNNAIYNATTIVQDPRNGFENIWYYGTGEFIGNSASLSGSLYRGQGIWKSVDNGVTWSQMPSTNSQFELLDSEFDYIFRLAVHPNTGDLYAATLKSVLRYDGTSWNTEITEVTPGFNANQSSDIVIANSGRVYAALGGGNATVKGIWTSQTGIGSWTRINTNSFEPSGRIVMALAPSNQNKLYCMFYNGNEPSSTYFDNNCPTPQQEVDLWLWNQNSQIFTSYNDRLPFEGGCSLYNDPFTTFRGYTMSINVKPDDENFVVIGASNAYKMENISDSNGTFKRIGGYLNATSYLFYNLAGDEHHADLHDFTFSANNPKIMFSASDGGIHRTNDITAETVGWTGLNTNFQTYQYYHVGIDPQEGSDLVTGGTQDNGTSVGGTNFSVPGFNVINDLTTHNTLLGGDGGAVAISRNGCGNNPTYFLSFQNGVVYRLCEQYELISPTGSNSQFVTYFYLDPENNHTLYYAGEDQLYRTTDSRNVNTSNWTNLGSTSLLGQNDWFQHMAASNGNYDPASSYLLLGGDEGRVYRLDDPHNTTTFGNAIDITPEGASLGFPSIVTGLAVHPNNNDLVMVTYSNYGNDNIFITKNARSNAPTWTLVERNLSSHSIRSAAIADVNGVVTYFVGTARGLYRSDNPETTDWQLEAPSELGLALISSLSYRASDGHLLIGTHGNGMYEAIPSQTLEISKKDEVALITLYPNPALSEISIKGPNIRPSETSYQIFNLKGQLVSQGYSIENPIPVETLSSGLYFVKLATESSSMTLKFYKK